MMRVHLYVLAGLLALAGCGLFLYKLLALGFPLWPDARTEIWQVEVRLSFEARGGPVRAELHLPQGSDGFAIVDQNFVSPGYGVVTERHPGHGPRAVFSIREAQGWQTLYYRAVVQPARGSGETGPDPVPDVVPPGFEGAERVAADNLVAAARQRSADDATLAALLVRWLREAQPAGEAALLLGRDPDARRKARVAVQLLRHAGLPARQVNGIALAVEQREAPLLHWAEVHAGGRWQALYPYAGVEAAAARLLPWWRGATPLAETNGAPEPAYEISTSRTHEPAIRTALDGPHALGSLIVGFSLLALPLPSQELFRTLLVIPAGILLLVVLRNIVGMKTFGTFMPVLIALAFRETGLVWGVVFFCAVVALGLAARFYLEHLKLLLVPRLAAVVIVVILIIAALSVLSFRLGIERGLSIGLFPIVIMTMTIERMTLVWEERGAREAFAQAAGSIVVGVLAYLLMNLRVVEHLFFVFPELLLVVLALTLLIGRYSGYRLSELRRFRALAP
jgi:hypothetical protein